MLDPGNYTGTYKVIGGELCLDFANTVSWRGIEREHDWLHNFSNYIAWGVLVGVISRDEHQSLTEVAELHPHEAEQTLKKAHELREVINALFSEVKNGQPIPQVELAALNAYLPETLVHLQAGVEDNRASWKWWSDGVELDCILWPVVWSATNLLMSDRLKNLRSCEACEWLYLDNTKNHSRRWCTMEDCGNRAKVRRFRQRAQSTSS